MNPLVPFFPKRLRRIRVYALIGDTGTGKSFRAMLVSEKYNIDLLIDDGLLIKGHRILAGRSAKREKNKVTAIKRAILDDPVHVEEIKKALSAEKFRSVLVLGTSEKMIARIVERLDLPYPDQIIYIEDIASRDEISMALATRRTKGKHVIPVPVIEVKQDPSHRVLENIRYFLKRHPLLRWKKKMVEKTVVQPPYDGMGSLSISEAALGQMILHCAQEYCPDVKTTKIRMIPSSDGYTLDVRLTFPLRRVIPDTLSGLHHYILSNVERISGIHIEELNLIVDHIERPIRPGRER